MEKSGIAELRKKIKYNVKDNAQFVEELRGRVQDYFKDKGISKFGNINMVLKTLFMFSVYFVPYALMISGVIKQPGLIFLMFIIMGFGLAGIGLSVMHDANHKAYSKHKGVNRILSYTLALLGGFQYNWQHQHNTLHHGYTNIYGFDEDINPPGGIFRFSPNSPYKKVHRFQYIYTWFLYGLMTIGWTINKDFIQIIQYRKDGIALDGKRSYGWILTEMIISKVLYYGYALVIPLLVLPIPWWLTVLAYLSMHFVAGFLLGIIFQVAHVMPDTKYPLPDKGGNMKNNWVVHQLLTTSDYSPHSRLFSWLIGGLNYQVEHHLFPRICHVHYRNISVIVKELTEKYKLPYNVQQTFGSALIQHGKMLKKLGAEA